MLVFSGNLIKLDVFRCVPNYIHLMTQLYVMSRPLKRIRYLYLHCNLFYRGLVVTFLPPCYLEWSLKSHCRVSKIGNKYNLYLAFRHV